MKGLNGKPFQNRKRIERKKKCGIGMSYYEYDEQFEPEASKNIKESKQRQSIERVNKGIRRSISFIRGSLSSQPRQSQSSDEDGKEGMRMNGSNELCKDTYVQFMTPPRRNYMN